MTNEERQQAIEWMKRRPVMMAGAKRMYDLAVEALEAYVPDMNVGKTEPSRESDTEITRCSDDTISRRAALDAIHCDITVTGRQNAELVAATIGVFADRIKALPPVQPKHGKWIERRTWSEGYGMGETYGKYWACNQCGREVKGFWNECGNNFCSNCGADMRERGEAE